MNSSLGGRSKCATEDIGISTRDKRQMTPNIGSTPRHTSRQLALQLPLLFMKSDVTYLWIDMYTPCMEQKLYSCDTCDTCTHLGSPMGGAIA
jgi:hypothetical protein